MRKILSFTLVCVMALAMLASCNPTAPATTTTTEPPAKTDAPKADDTATAAPVEPDAPASEPWSWTLYYNYDWWGIRTWASDEVSKYWKEKFNMDIEQSKPDSDAEGKLNLMLTSGDLPDVILMDRGASNKRIADLGLWQDLAPFMAVNTTLQDEFESYTLDLLKLDGKLYAIPHWARKGPTGGNDVWMYNKRLYDAVGAPSLKTFESLYEYAKAVKEQSPNTQEGLPVIPFATQNNNDAYEKIVANAFYRSMGGPNGSDARTASIDGKIQLKLRDPRFRAAALEANKWYREGLISDTQFTDTNDQMIEKFVAGRTALLYYDHSQDDNNNFRKILRETYPGDDYVILTDPVYPPAAGVTKTYADEKATMGWNVHGITTSAKEPQKIFDFLCYMLTKQGSIDMMYGPPGLMYDELNADGNPILKRPESSLTSEESENFGVWKWSFCNHSDNVDLTKFAVNAMQPADQRSWVISTQSDVLTPIMFTDDEYANFGVQIDQLSDLGIARKLCEEQYKAEIPKIIMAATEAEAVKLYDDLLKFYDDNGFAEVEAIYEAKHQENIAIQGFSRYE